MTPSFDPWFWCALARPAVIEILEAAGASVIVIDLQHGEASLDDAVACLRASRRSHLVVRLGFDADPDLVGRLLDAGVSDLMFPQVESAGDAADLVALTRYPPEGRRGVAGAIRANGYGADTEYFTAGDNRPRTIMQIETLGAARNAAAIAAVDGVDALFAGTSDLAADAGVIGRPTADVVLDTLTRIRDGARAAKSAVMLGAFCGAAQKLKDHCRNLGYDFLVIGSDSQFIRDGARTALAHNE